MKRKGRFGALLGDVVRSRRATDRARLQRALRGALSLANHRVASVQPLTPTIGDEFQALYAHPGAALEASLLVRLSLMGIADVRFGIGWGDLRLHDRSLAPFGQDGPAWWAARAAIERVVRSQRSRERSRGLRTVFLVAGEVGSDEAAQTSLVNSMLLCRDELVAHLRERDARVMLGLLGGRTPSELAADEGVTQSAISQRAIAKGLYALREAVVQLRSAEWE